MKCEKMCIICVWVWGGGDERGVAAQIINDRNSTVVAIGKVRSEWFGVGCDAGQRRGRKEYTLEFVCGECECAEGLALPEHGLI